jgi:hypothetical protein
MALRDLDDLSHRISQYIYDNGGSDDLTNVSGFTLEQNGHGSVSIASWDYSFPKPKHSDLRRIDYSRVLDMFEQKREKSKIIRLAVLSTAMIDTLPDMYRVNGSLVFDEDEKKIKIFHSNMWNMLP